MGLYVNRIKYKGGSPRLGASSGIINNAVVDGYYFYDDNYSPTPSEPDYSLEYFTVTSWQDNNGIRVRAGLQNNSSTVNLYWSLDKQTWTQAPTSASTITTLNKGEKIYFKGNNTSLFNQIKWQQHTFIGASKYFEYSGNIMSLLWGDSFIDKTEAPNKDELGIFQNLCSVYLYSNYNWLLTTRNLIIPLTYYPKYCISNMFESCSKIVYFPKELQKETYVHPNALHNFLANSSSKINESPVLKLTTSVDSNSSPFSSSNCKKTISFVSSGYPTTPSSTTVKYKLSTNTSVSGSEYRDFDTLQANNQFISIWAETDTPYDGIVAGCGDYFVAGDTVTLEYVPVNANFNGYYDENDNLLSSNSTYTFTAQRSMKIKVKTT